MKDFAEYFGKSPELMGAEEVRGFQLYMIRDNQLALGTVALRMGSLRFLYKKTLRFRDIDVDDLPLLRAPRKLPVVLSQEEVVRLIEAAPNLHYHTLLMLLYATGLRCRGRAVEDQRSQYVGSFRKQPAGTVLQADRQRLKPAERQRLPNGNGLLPRWDAFLAMVNRRPEMFRRTQSIRNPSVSRLWATRRLWFTT